MRVTKLPILLVVLEHRRNATRMDKSVLIISVNCCVKFIGKEKNRSIRMSLREFPPAHRCRIPNKWEFGVLIKSSLLSPGNYV